MLYAGVDIGSTTTKCILLDENCEEKAFAHIMTEFNRNISGEKVLKEAVDLAGASLDDVQYIVATGYGRKAFLRADKDTPEVVAHAKGTVHLLPEARTIIDIGGQDSKVIALDSNGMIETFEMNDRCAAGTGRFFEVLTHRLLGIEMDELSDLILKSQNHISISSVCTVFAETEIISYLSQNVPIEDVAAGTAHCIARRIIAQGRGARIPFNEPVIFSGGAANNEGIRRVFAEMLEKTVIAIPRPQCTAAYGAALDAVRFGREKSVS